jgi:hypothetical protein
MRLLAAALPAILMLTPACHRAPSGDTPEEQTRPATAVAPAATSATPTDHLAPDELVEGPDQAFGVALPRALEVKGTFVDVVYAAGHASVHALVQYFRDRLQDGSLREGADAATFEHVKVRGKPGLELLVHINRVREGSNVEIRNSTPPVAPPLPDEAARWKQVGLTPHGHLADPTHLD